MKRSRERDDRYCNFCGSTNKAVKDDGSIVCGECGRPEKAFRERIEMKPVRLEKK